ncbi:dynactin subunit 4-like [Palaemon carinicauda]|uniref:dynactin subunit 4-like n=1 Tax=Palaemon carinicauda TaxID=392227 RepID=UPI0035B69E32
MYREGLSTSAFSAPQAAHCMHYSRFVCILLPSSDFYSPFLPLFSLLLRLYSFFILPLDPTSTRSKLIDGKIILASNRCANRFDCPSCGHTLSTRATSIQAPNPEDSSKTVARKVYYLACTSCRWTSRDVNLSDQTVATGGWAEQDNVHYKYLQSLLEHYYSVAQQEKVESERKRSSFRKSSYLSLSEKFSLSSTSMIGRKSLPSFSSLTSKGDPGLTSELSPCVAEEEVDGLHDNIFTEEVDLSKVTTMDQRMASPEWQPEETDSLYPLHKHILVKRSLRCLYCEHNLSKPEYYPSLIKFKIQLGALGGASGGRQPKHEQPGPRGGDSPREGRLVPLGRSGLAPGTAGLGGS